VSLAASLAFAAGALGVIGLGLLVGPLAPRSRGARGTRLLRALAAVGGRLRSGAPAPRDLAARIAAAGQPAGLSARDLMAAKIAAALAFAAGGMLSPRPRPEGSGP
jgi:hypothetical protein